jgi:hypothetical protein
MQKQTQIAFQTSEGDKISFWVWKEKSMVIVGRKQLREYVSRYDLLKIFENIEEFQFQLTSDDKITLTLVGKCLLWPVKYDDEVVHPGQPVTINELGYLKLYDDFTIIVAIL